MSGWKLSRVIARWGVSLAALFLSLRAAVADTPPTLALGAFAPWDEAAAIPAAYDGVVPIDDPASLSLLPDTTSVARDVSAPSARRFYLTGIVGGSFLVVSADNSPSSSLTEGFAAGMALERSNGRIRIEVEGRYRDSIEQTYLGFNENYSIRDPVTVTMAQAQGYGWSALANVWRDFRWTEQVDLYGGGGIGAAGFQTTYQKLDVTPPPPRVDRSITGYAWQIGLGAIWNMSDRVALDASYRIFGTGWTITREDLAYGFLRSEILLSVRIYEPFRGLLR